MASDPKQNPQAKPGEPDRAQLMRVLVPAGAIAVVVIVVAVVASMTGGVRKMSDGSDGSADDPGLKEVSAGVKIRDLKEGQGAECQPGAKVKIKYTGWLTNGTVFDSNDGIEFSLKQLIKGWQIGIPGMKVGGVRKLVISPEKGYGPMGQPPKIPGGSTLIFEIELLDAPAPRNLEKLSDGTAPGADDPGLRDIGDGLKIRDLKEGTGAPAQPGTSVTVHYTGWLTNGKMFDSSFKAGEPITFSLNRVVKGWGLGIPGMKPGGVRKLVIPAALGYGPDGSPPDIPPNATLVFEVELLKVN